MPPFVHAGYRHHEKQPPDGPAAETRLYAGGDEGRSRRLAIKGGLAIAGRSAWTRLINRSVR